MDVKFGSGAFMDNADDARTLAESLVLVANGAGLPTSALLTDMNEPLASAAGNAVEIAYAVDYLTGPPSRAALPRGDGGALRRDAACSASSPPTIEEARAKIEAGDRLRQGGGEFSSAWWRRSAGPPISSRTAEQSSAGGARDPSGSCRSGRASCRASPRATSASRSWRSAAAARGRRIRSTTRSASRLSPRVGDTVDARASARHRACAQRGGGGGGSAHPARSLSRSATRRPHPRPSVLERIGASSMSLLVAVTWETAALGRALPAALCPIATSSCWASRFRPDPPSATSPPGVRSPAASPACPISKRSSRSAPASIT